MARKKKVQASVGGRVDMEREPVEAGRVSELLDLVDYLCERLLRMGEPSPLAKHAPHEFVLSSRGRCGWRPLGTVSGFRDRDRCGQAKNVEIHVGERTADERFAPLLPRSSMANKRRACRECGLSFHLVLGADNNWRLPKHQEPGRGPCRGSGRMPVNPNGVRL